MIGDRVDSYNVDKKYGVIHSFTLFGASPALAANYSVFFTAPHALNIVRVLESHTAVSVSGTLQIELLTGTQAPGAGTNILKSTISTAGAINTVTERKGTRLAVTRMLPGDRLALVDAGVLTGSTDLNVTIYFTVASRGDFIL
jgi:hypothetical protein